MDRPPVDRRINLQTGPQCVLHVLWSQYLYELDGKGALSHSSSPHNHQFESFLVSTHFQSGPEPLRAHRRTSGRVKSRSRSKPASCKETPTWTVFKTEVWCANDGLGATPVKQSPDGVPLSTQHNNTHRRVCFELGLTAGLWQSPSPFLFFFRLFSRRPPVSFWAELLPLFSFLKKLQQQLHHTDVRGGGDFPHARTNTRQPSPASN